MFQFAQQFKNQEKQNGFNNELKHFEIMLQEQSPWVSVNEIDKFRQLMASASVGEHFLIQANDCAESLYECDIETAFAKLDFIRHLTTFFYNKTGRSVIRIETLPEDSENNSYTISQNPYFNERIYPRHETQRCVDPQRISLNYNCWALSCRRIGQWNEGIGIEKKIYTSRNISSLNFEQMLTRADERTGLNYNLSTHFPCLDKYTMNSTQHINYLKKIANPIALKIDLETSASSLIEIINELDPEQLPGRITLIPGLGLQHIQRILPQLITAVKNTQHKVLWSCDPMHGNTEIANPGIKIRKLSSIVDEIKTSFLIHKQMNSQLNAIHLDVTHQDVTECIDYESSFRNSVNNVERKHQNWVAPRLNYAQAMHVMRCIGRYAQG